MVSVVPVIVTIRSGQEPSVILIRAPLCKNKLLSTHRKLLQNACGSQKLSLDFHHNSRQQKTSGKVKRRVRIHCFPKAENSRDCSPPNAVFMFLPKSTSERPSLFEESSFNFNYKTSPCESGCDSLAKEEFPSSNRPQGYLAQRLGRSILQSLHSRKTKQELKILWRNTTGRLSLRNFRSLCTSSQRLSVETKSFCLNTRSSLLSHASQNSMFTTGSSEKMSSAQDFIKECCQQVLCALTQIICCPTFIRRLGLSENKRTKRTHDILFFLSPPGGLCFELCSKVLQLPSIESHHPLGVSMSMILSIFF